MTIPTAQGSHPHATLPAVQIGAFILYAILPFLMGLTGVQWGYLDLEGITRLLTTVLLTYVIMATAERYSSPTLISTMSCSGII